MFGDFWDNWKNSFLNKNGSGYILGNLRKNWAAFLIHYLVTLPRGTCGGMCTFCT